MNKKKWTAEEEVKLIKRFKALATAQDPLGSLVEEFDRPLNSIYWKLRTLRHAGEIKHYDAYSRTALTKPEAPVKIQPAAKVRWVVQRDFPDSESMHIVPLGDIHWGHPTLQKNPGTLEKLYGYRDWILENDAYTILMGDYIENSTKTSVGAGVYEQIMNPQQQIEEFVEFVRPLAEEGRILGMLTGNHENRSHVQSGIDLTAHMAQVLGAPYLQYSGFIRVRVGSQTYSFYVEHGGSGSVTLSGKMNAVEKMAVTNDADIYLCGHVHDLVAWSKLHRVYDSRNRCMVHSTKHFCITGHFLGYEGSYAEMKSYSIGKTGAPRIRLAGDRRDIHIST